MATHQITRGLDIPIAGEATGQPVQLDPPSSVAYAPTEFRGIIPKPALKAGEPVKAGGVLFYHKRNADLVFRSPVAGAVAEVRRGHKRVITDLVVDRQGEDAESFAQHDPGQLQGIDRSDARAKLLASGLWPYLRTRPLNNIADPDVTPQSIWVGALETGPLMPGADVMLGEGDAEALQAGIHVLKALTDGPVHFASHVASSHPAYSKLTGVDSHKFGGPHPAGDPTVQINLVDPPRGSNAVWWIRAWEVALIGRHFLEGRFPTDRVYAAVGTGLDQPRFVRTLLGAPLAHITGQVPADCRWIRGSVLSGTAVDESRWSGFYDYGVHVLPAKVERELLGWILPGLSKFSFHRSFLSGFSFARAKSYDLRPGLNGGLRAMIPFAHYDKVIATPDISPHFLFRSIIAGDLEDSIELGMLDISEEEAALMTYICPSKIEFDVALRDMLAVYERET